MDVREREVVMHEGDPADKFCILLEGMVSIQKSPGPGKPRKEVALVNAGEYLGEIGFLNNQPRTASCVAKTKVKVRLPRLLAFTWVLTPEIGAPARSLEGSIPAGVVLPQLLYLGRDEFDKYLGHLSEAFLQHAESTYSTQQADMPAWLLDAKAQGAFYDPNASADSTEEPDEPIRTGSLTNASEEAEANVYKKKKDRKKPTEGLTGSVVAAAGMESSEDEAKKKKKKKKTGEKEKAKEKEKEKPADTPITPGDLDRLRDLLAGTFKNKYGSLAHAFAEMDVNKSDIVDADVIWHLTTEERCSGSSMHNKASYHPLPCQVRSVRSALDALSCVLLGWNMLAYPSHLLGTVLLFQWRAGVLCLYQEEQHPGIPKAGTGRYL